MSKGLKAIQQYKIVICPQCQYHDEKCNVECFSNIIEKELKALEIIKKKRVLIDVLLELNTLEDYNEFKSKKEQLTQEEYDLLREVLV